jgi:hypothetical protein
MITLAKFLKLRNFEVRGNGTCRQMESPSISLDKCHPYYFCRFLSDLDTLVELTSDDLERIRIATILTRRFLSQADWVIDTCPPPDPETRSATKPSMLIGAGCKTVMIAGQTHLKYKNPLITRVSAFYNLSSFFANILIW